MWEVFDGGSRAIIIVFFLTLAGCSKQQYSYAEVEGKVTLNKQPLSGVVVRFYPISDGKSQIPFATGTTDASGVYTLSTGDDKPGAVVGPHRVVVSYPWRDPRTAPPQPIGLPIPLRYTVADQTPLTIEVKAGERQTINLALEY